MIFFQCTRKPTCAFHAYLKKFPLKISISFKEKIPETFPFEFFTNNTKMPQLAFSSLLHENKKSSDKMLPRVGIEPRQPVILSPTPSFL